MSKSWVLPTVAVVCLSAPIASAAARDRDGDRLPDRWERRHGLSPTKKSARRDPDEDGLRNRREFRLRLHPRRADTDGDGFKDGREVRAGTNPRKRRSHPRRRRRAPGARGFPTPSSTGVPSGWTPARTRTSPLRVTRPGAVVQDVLLQNTDLTVEAPNVTIRRVKLQGGYINNQPGPTCRANGLTIEDTTIEPPPGQTATKEFEGVVRYGGYTARRLKIWRRSEGFRVSSKEAGCGPVRIEDSFVKIVDSDDCVLHADGIQGYGGDALTVVNTTVDGTGIECGTAPFYYPRGQDNTRVDVNRLLVMGAGYPFRNGMPGTVRGLKIVNDSWVFGPIDVRCSVLSAWQADIVRINSNYQVTRTVRPQPCNTEEGN